MQHSSQSVTAKGSRLGQSDNAARHERVSLKLFKIYRNQDGCEDFVTEVEIEYDNLKNIIENYAIWCSTNLIPKGFDENLESKQDGFVKTDTLEGYIGKVLMYMRYKFPNHPDFKGLKGKEQPVWWSDMRKNFVKDCNNFQIKNRGVAPSLEPKGVNLYWDLETDLKGLYLEKYPEDYWKTIDLKSILRRLVSKGKLQPHNDSMQERCWLGITAECIGRGGEIKFQSYNDWEYDHKLNVTDIVWKDSKVSNKYSMPMLPDAKWDFNFYHQNMQG